MTKRGSENLGDQEPLSSLLVCSGGLANQSLLYPSDVDQRLDGAARTAVPAVGKAYDLLYFRIGTCHNGLTCLVPSLGPSRPSHTTALVTALILLIC